MSAFENSYEHEKKGDKFMEKKFENNLSPEQELYIKEKLFEKYGENLENYGITVNSNVEICNMAEFLITEHPEKYAKSMSTENDYRNDENLRKIYAVRIIFICLALLTAKQGLTIGFWCLVFTSTKAIYLSFTATISSSPYLQLKFLLIIS